MTDDQAKGLFGLAGKLLGGLPAQFLLLCLLNLAFLAAVVWMIDRAAEYRQALLAPIIAACVEKGR